MANQLDTNYGLRSFKIQIMADQLDTNYGLRSFKIQILSLEKFTDIYVLVPSKTIQNNQARKEDG
jgi:hypothetical protein